MPPKNPDKSDSPKERHKDAIKNLREINFESNVDFNEVAIS